MDLKKKLLVALSIIFVQVNLAQSGYRVVEGKSVGIWPHNDRFKSLENIRELKQKWGFNYFLLAAIYSEKEKEMAVAAGFDADHIAFQIYMPDVNSPQIYFKEKLEKLGKIWGYYFDEPISREHSYKDFLNLLAVMSDNGLYPYSKLIISELDEKKALKVSPFVDDVTYSGYGNHEKLGLDQAESWSTWKNFVGSKFGMPWISADADSNEYRTLFKAAKDLGFNFVWLYALEPLEENREVSDLNYEKFCEAAVEYGFMKKEK